MSRVIAAVLFVGLIALAGCKKDTPKESPEPTKSAETSPKLPMPAKGLLAAPPECRKLCMVVGKCTLRDGKCLATTVEGCRASYGCEKAGMCQPKDGLCIALNDADCEKSPICETQGKCMAINGKCDNKNAPPASSANPAGSGK